MRAALATATTFVLAGLAWSGPSHASEGSRISIDLKDADIHNVFRLLADVGKVNVVVSDEVKGRVTLKLTQVPWRRALEVISQTKGLGFERSGNIYYVDTLERMADRAEAETRIRDAKKKSAPLKTVLIPVRYARAKELAPIVKDMLSERGRLQIDERTNTLIVTDVADSTERVSSTMGR